MQFAISTDAKGVEHHSAQNLAFIIASLPNLICANRRVVITDRHAQLSYANLFVNEIPEEHLPWKAWQQIDFKRRWNNNASFECYQAEALVHQALPLRYISGIAVSNMKIQESLKRRVKDAGLDLHVVHRPLWFFS